MTLGGGAPAGGQELFEDVFLGGFECSCHSLEDGRRLDLASSTRHVELADADYARLRNVGMTACRDGVSWIHAVRSGGFDFDRALPMIRAAERHSVRVIWDLMHFGWPDDIDVFSPAFPARFARYASAFVRWLSGETDQVPFVVPVNEMSLAWAGGDVRCMNPFQAARGVELKAQLVRACIEGMESIRSISPGARFLHPEPVINIVPDLDKPKTWRRVESDNLLQYQAWSMLIGEQWPSLGGHPKYLDVIGVNFYPDNQFMSDGTTIQHDDVRYKPFGKMLLDVYERFHRPMIVSETGSEGEHRAPWFRYVAGQCVSAIRRGCELHGVTLYPVVSHPGWLDERHCHNGLWDYADDSGHRPLYEPLARELVRQRGPLMVARAEMLQRSSIGESGIVAV